MQYKFYFHFFSFSVWTCYNYFKKQWKVDCLQQFVLGQTINEDVYGYGT